MHAGLLGRYKAWLADTKRSPANRFVKSLVPYRLPPMGGEMEGPVVADSYADLVDCTNSDCIQHSIDRDETGTFKAGSPVVWSGTASDGTSDPTIGNNLIPDPMCPGCGTFCENWTSTEAPTDLEAVVVGRLENLNERWTRFDISFCNAGRFLYCFEQ